MTYMGSPKVQTHTDETAIAVLVDSDAIQIRESPESVAIRQAVATGRLRTSRAMQATPEPWYEARLTVDGMRWRECLIRAEPRVGAS